MHCGRSTNDAMVPLEHMFEAFALAHQRPLFRCQAMDLTFPNTALSDQKCCPLVWGFAPFSVWCLNF